MDAEEEDQVFFRKTNLKDLIYNFTYLNIPQENKLSISKRITTLEGVK
jgi:hypothetical protein